MDAQELEISRRPCPELMQALFLPLNTVRLAILFTLEFSAAEHFGPDALCYLHDGSATVTNAWGHNLGCQRVPTCLQVLALSEIGLYQ